jgi:hypothetical protein
MCTSSATRVYNHQTITRTILYFHESRLIEEAFGSISHCNNNLGFEPQPRPSTFASTDTSRLDGNARAAGLGCLIMSISHCNT